MGIEFSPLPVSNLDLLRFADHWSEKYPELTEVPALEPSQAPGQPGPQLTLQLSASVPPVRYWLTSTDGQYLVQLQRDRLLVNWRRTVEGNEYPGFEELRGRFEEQLSSLVRDIGKGETASIVVSSVEYTYFNRVVHDGRPSAVFRHLAEPSSELPGELLAMRFQEIRLLSETDGTRGQLTISSEPERDDNRTNELFTVSTRWFPEALSAGARLGELIDRSHEVSRAAFVAITTAEKQKEWGRS
ncbi:TIGR04255 family protein [Agromyces laixinhei]|uniref:TIGR04255 family protein n=1 Tax=Agromyces laixinhei TaxID=2585717 RepID=UPI00143CE461|nr:TIGR04255 family protein [Agromyces laixinhei]